MWGGQGKGGSGAGPGSASSFSAAKSGRIRELEREENERSKKFGIVPCHKHRGSGMVIPLLQVGPSHPRGEEEMKEKVELIHTMCSIGRDVGKYQSFSQSPSPVLLRGGTPSMSQSWEGKNGGDSLPFSQGGGKRHDENCSGWAPPSPAVCGVCVCRHSRVGLRQCFCKAPSGRQRQAVKSHTTEVSYGEPIEKVQKVLAGCGRGGNNRELPNVPGVKPKVKESFVKVTEE